MSTNKDEYIREKLLALLIGEPASEEQYVDTKAKFLIDDLVPFIKQYGMEDYNEGVKRASDKVFIDIPTGHEITRQTMKNAKHDKDCSSSQGFMCDCEIINATQFAVDEAKKRALTALRDTQEAKK